MKTVVLGVFDDTESARSVLHQLADSPLDLRRVSVLHRDAVLQRELAADAGLPRDRSAGMLFIIGALLGAAVGAWLGSSSEIAVIADVLGPLLAAAAGGALGAVVAVATGILLEPLAVPEAHTEAVAAAIEAGATSIVVATDSLPTARAISDLFHMAGARDLELARPDVGSVDQRLAVESDIWPAAEDSLDRTGMEPSNHPARPDPDDMFRPRGYDPGARE